MSQGREEAGVHYQETTTRANNAMDLAKCIVRAIEMVEGASQRGYVEGLRSPWKRLFSIGGTQISLRARQGQLLPRDV